jgi:transposase-like protein
MAMALNRRRFTCEFKLQVLRAIEVGKSMARVAREHEIHPNQIGKWRREHAQYAEQAFAGNDHRYKAEARIADLARMVSRLTMENAFLKKALAPLEAQQHERTDKRGRCWLT